MEFHDVLRVRIRHKPGFMAKLCTAVAEKGAILGDIETIATGGEHSIRDVTIEAKDDATIESVTARLSEIEGISVLSRVDKVYERHRGGKLEVRSRVRLEKISDLRQIYTPGVARVCRAIHKAPELARELTWAGSNVAICTNGTRVLGLGDIGVRASLPVMEGKAVLYERCIGLSAVPILVDTKDPGTFVKTVETIAASFGGIHLEDISAPECFEIERRLIEALPQPVMHDDVHGTAVVTMAAAIAACRQVDMRLDEAVVGQIGLGAAGYGIASLIHDAGVKRVIATDPSPWAQEQAREHGIEIVDLATVMAEADVVVATTGRAGLISPDLVRPGQVILALTNPVPEIEPDAAVAAGAAFAADGTSVNNVLGYPGIFRGALLAGASEINLTMKRAAAWALAGLTVESELVPDVLDRNVHETVAQAVRQAAIESGVADSGRIAPGL